MDDFDKPYKRMAAIEESLETNSLIDHYVNHYQRKFRTTHVFEPGTLHLTHIKTVRSMCVTAKVDPRAVIETYLNTNDQWFKNQSYSLGCLVKNMNRVLPSVRTAPRAGDSKEGLELDINCDACGARFKLIHPLNPTYVTQMVRCEECKKTDRGLMKSANGTTINLQLPDVPEGW